MAQSALLVFFKVLTSLELLVGINDLFDHVLVWQTTLEMILHYITHLADVLPAANPFVDAEICENECWRAAHA